MNGRQRQWWTLAAGVAAVAFVVWLAWPSLVRDDRPDVLVVADDFVAGGRRSIELRAREDGRSVAWLDFDRGWCADPSRLRSEVDDTDPHRLVVSFRAPSACVAAVAAALGGRHPMVVAQPGTGPPVDDLTDAGFTVIDPAHLVGTPGADPRRACEWWETCDGDGRVAVRERSGALTQAGQERVARLIVAAL